MLSILATYDVKATWMYTANPLPSKARYLEGGGAVSDKGRSALADAVGEREPEVGGEELLDVWAADVLVLLDLDHTENVDGPEASTVPGSHVLVHALDSISPGQVAVLLVHVVGTGTRVVTEPDSKVLDLERLLFVDSVDADDLTGGLLDLLELPQEVPVTRLGHDLIRSEDAHPVDFWVGVIFGGQVTADDLVFLKTHFE